MVRSVVEANVPHIIVVLFTRVLIRGGLENGHYNGAGDAGTRLSCMDRLGLDASKITFHFEISKVHDGSSSILTLTQPSRLSRIRSLSQGILLLSGPVTMRPYRSSSTGPLSGRTVLRWHASRPPA